MARIPKDLLKSSEVKFLTEQGLIFDKNNDFYGLRDKDVDQVLNLLKTKSMNEAVLTSEEIELRAYTLKAVTMVMQALKQAESFTDYMCLFSVINSMVTYAPSEASRLLAVLKSNMKW